MKAGFKVGDLIWARVKNYPPWPAKIEPQPEPVKKQHVYVYFFGAKADEQYAWVANSAISKYNEETKAKLSEASTKAGFKAGLELIEAEYKKMMAESTAEAEQSATNSDKEGSEGKSELQKRKRQPKKKFGIEDEEGSSASKTPKGKRKSTAEAIENGASPAKQSAVDDYLKDDFLSGTVDNEANQSDHAAFDLGTIPDTVASSRTIGVLGLGVMSTGIVHNLLKTGHKVNLWSRVIQKCKTLKEKVDEVKEGRLTVYETPCDVMAASDIVFNCSSDPETVKTNVFGNCGVSHGVESYEGKGYVEMTGIDPQTSLKTCEEIQSKKGRYLEAQLQGSREESADGTLVILTAGDNSLFMDCQSCFKAIGKSSLYLGAVGVATKVYIILQMMQGINLVALSEAFVLADRCGISQKDIMNIFNMTNMASPYLLSKARKIVDKNYKEVDLSIKHIQKDMRLALGLSEDLMQPMMMAAAANEVFKHSRKLGYDDYDSSCIYMKARY